MRRNEWLGRGRMYVYFNGLCFPVVRGNSHIIWWPSACTVHYKNNNFKKLHDSRFVAPCCGLGQVYCITGDHLHNLAAHHRTAHNPAARWCAGSVVCATRIGNPLHNLSSQTAMQVGLTLAQCRDASVLLVADVQYRQWVSVKRSNVCSLKCILICCVAVNNDIFVGFGWCNMCVTTTPLPICNAFFMQRGHRRSLPILRKKLLNGQMPEMKSQPLEQSPCLETQSQLEQSIAPKREIRCEKFQNLTSVFR